VILRRVAVAAVFLAAAACGRPIFVPPSGPGAPADGSSAWTEATGVCRSAKSISATIRVSGRAGSQRIWPLSVDTAVTGGDVYMGATAAGRSVFILAGSSTAATLWLRRENRVVRAPAGKILEAILGIEVAPDRLLAVLTGCATRDLQPTAAATFEKLLAVDTGDGRVYLEQHDNRWRTRAAELQGFRLEYRWRQLRWPEKIWIWSTPGREPVATVDVTVEDAGLDPVLPSGVFNAPSGAAGADPMTLEELRSALSNKGAIP
jgi:hypothetical protein